MQNAPCTPNVEVIEAAVAAAADVEVVAEPMVSERNDTVRVLTRRSRKDEPRDEADPGSTESMAA